MQRDIEISPREEPDLGEINKGVELLMRRKTNHPPIENLTRRKQMEAALITIGVFTGCLLYTSPSPRDQRGSRMPSCA